MSSPMLELSYRSSIGSAHSTGSKYSMSDSSMIDLVRGLNGASFDRLIDGDNASSGQDAEPQPCSVTANDENPAGLQKRRSSASIAACIRGRLSSQNLVSLFGPQKVKEEERTTKGDSKQNPPAGGRQTSLGKRNRKAPKSPSSTGRKEDPDPEVSDVGESTDTLQVTGDPKIHAVADNLEVRTLAEEAPSARPSKNPFGNSEKESSDRISAAAKGNLEENAKIKSHKGKDPKPSAPAPKQSLKNHDPPAVPAHKHSARHTALASLDPGLQPTKSQAPEPADLKSDDLHPGTTWMRKSASSLFPSLARDANTLPAFQRWSALLGSGSAEAASVFLPRASHDLNTETAPKLQHDGIDPQGSRADCTEHGRRVRWRRLLQGHFSWNRKSSRVKEQPICSSAPVTLPLENPRGKKPHGEKVSRREAPNKHDGPEKNEVQPAPAKSSESHRHSGGVEENTLAPPRRAEHGPISETKTRAPKSKSCRGPEPQPKKSKPKKKKAPKPAPAEKGADLARPSASTQAKTSSSCQRR